LTSSLGARLTVPAAAVLQTGQQPVVWVEQAPGHFAQRRVRLGARVGSDYVVLAGLEAGQRVAATGGFLLDSEAQLSTASGDSSPAVIDAAGRGVAMVESLQVALQVPAGGAKVGMTSGELGFTEGGRPVA